MADLGFFSPLLSRMRTAGKFVSPFHQHITSFRACMVIAQNIAALDVGFWSGPPRDTEREQIPMPTDLERLLDRPNPDIRSREEFIILTVLHLLLTGEAWQVLLDNVGRVVTDADAKPRFLLVKCKQEVRHASEKTATTTPIKSKSLLNKTGWFDAATDLVLPDEGALQSKLPNPTPGQQHRGFSPAQVGKTEIETDWMSAVYQNAYIKNGAEPQGYLSTKQGMGGNIRTALRQSWDQRHKGPFKAGRVAVLSHGLEYKRTGDNHQEMQYLEGRKFSREQNSILWGVPESELGYTSDTKYLNGISGNDAMWAQVFLPLMRLVEAAWNDPFYGIARRYSNPRTDKRAWMGFDRTRVKAIMDRIADKMDQADKLFRMGVKVDDINRRLSLGLPSNPGVSDVPMFPLQFAPAEMIIDGDYAPEQQGSNGQNSGDKKTIEDIIAAAVKAATPQPYRERWVSRAAMIRSIVDDIESARRQMEPLAAKEAARYAFEYREAQLAKIDAVFGESYRAATVAARAEDDPDATDAAIQALVASVLLSQTEWEDRVAERFAPILENGVRLGAGTVSVELGGLNFFDIQAPAVKDMLVGMADDVRSIESTIRRNLKRTLIEGIIGNETVPELKDRVGTVMNTTTKRAKAIARTEAGTAINGGRYAAQKAEGVWGTEWHSGLTDATRDSHRSVHGEVRKHGKTFSNGLRFPLEPGATASEVVNCLCLAITVEEDEKPKE